MGEKYTYMLDEYPYALDTVKGHGFTVGDTINFHGMGNSEYPPAEEPSLCVLTKRGTKYVITYGEGDTALTWEFGPAAKVWASKAEATAPAGHGFGRSGMLCGLPYDGYEGTTQMRYVTCNGCRDALVLRTADGVEITDGMPVFDYDLNVGRVDLSTLNTDGWFRVVKGEDSWSLMDGVRVATRHPFSRALASDVLAAMAQPAEVEIHTGDGTVITEADAKARIREAFKPVEPIPANLELFSDRDMGAQILAYLGTDVDGFYVDGIIGTIIARKGGAVNIDTIEPDEFTAIVQTYATMPDTVARVGSDYLNVSAVPSINSGIPHVFVPKAIGEGSGPLFCVAPCHGHVSMPFHVTEEEVWSGTGTLIRPAIRTALGRRKRKATKKARRAVKGGF